MIYTRTLRDDYYDTVFGQPPNSEHVHRSSGPDALLVHLRCRQYGMHNDTRIIKTRPMCIHIYLLYIDRDYQGVSLNTLRNETLDILV